MSPKFIAILQALFVTFLWSTSWVIIKIGLDGIPPLTFAALRYGIAFIILLTFTLRLPANRAAIRALTRADLGRLAALGLVYYAITQGTSFLTLQYLPAVTFSLLLNFSTVVIAVMGIFMLAEYPNRQQWIGIVIFLTGVVLYFSNDNLGVSLLGLGFGLASMLANSAGSVMGRNINRTHTVSPLIVTLISMGIGAAILGVTSRALEPMPALTLTDWSFILWLAVINTALTFPLWNHTLRVLSAVESSVINNTMLIQIALLAWIFLGESITWIEAIGLLIAAAGILLVNISRTHKAKVRN